MGGLAIDSRWTVRRCVLTGFGLCVLGSLFDVLIHPYSSLSLAFVDDALVGVAAGLLVFFYERRQRLEVIRRLEMTRQMNDQVRNSLQVISSAASLSERQELVKAVQSAAARIE